MPFEVAENVRKERRIKTKKYLTSLTLTTQTHSKLSQKLKRLRQALLLDRHQTLEGQPRTFD